MRLRHTTWLLRIIVTLIYRYGIFVCFTLLLNLSNHVVIFRGYCQDGPTATDCYVFVGCDLSFPSISFPDTYLHMLRLDLNFTELTTIDDVRRSPFVYSGMFWDEDLRYDRYLFQVEYIPWNSSAYCYNFSFRIRDIQTEDAGTYHVNLRGIYYDWTAGPMLF